MKSEALGSTAESHLTTLCPYLFFIWWTTTPNLIHLSDVHNHYSDEAHDTIMPSKKKANAVLASLAINAEDTKPHSCADFRRNWTPTEFCKLSLTSEQPFFWDYLLASIRFSSYKWMADTILPLNTPQFTRQCPCCMTSAPTSRSLERHVKCSIR